MGLSLQEVESVLCGEASGETTHRFLLRMGEVYPVDPGELMVPVDDSDAGVNVMKRDASAKSSRITYRKNSAGERTAYYEYWDTAMMRLGPFLPELIRQLRETKTPDPLNPEVAYNEGHLNHQYTFFTGPINFYYDLNGTKHCLEFQPGDSCYCTPWWPHTFTTRDRKAHSWIVAVTYGGDVRRAQKEIYQLRSRMRHYRLDTRRIERGTGQLIRHHFENECLTWAEFDLRAQRLGCAIRAARALDETAAKSPSELEECAAVLGVHVSDLMLVDYKPELEVPFTRFREEDGYDYPNEPSRLYRLYALARSPAFPTMKGFNLHVHGELADLETQGWDTGLHSYVYNYGTEPVTFWWSREGEMRQDRLEPGDSACIQPWVKHAFGRAEGAGIGQLCLMRAAGAVNQAVQKEMSYMSENSRLYCEDRRWFS